MKFKNYKGKPSSMDSSTGESSISVTLPLKGLSSGTYPLVLDNKIGIALTPDNEDAGIKGKLPVVIIK
jgi:hypothetical protein